jgi:hypothetical protein
LAITTLLLPFVCLAADSVVKVRTKESGSFEFSGLRLRTAPGKFCRFSGSIDNQTEGSWSEGGFAVTVHGNRPDERFKMSLTVDRIPFGTKTAFDEYCLDGEKYLRVPPFEAVSYSLVFEGGYWAPGPNIVRKAAEKAHAAKIAKADIAKSAREATIRARAEFRAKFPTIQSGFTSAFVGSDKKCSAQFQEAVGMEGLEKRKRLADLITFGCGFIVPNLTHVAIERKDGSFALVKMIDGDKANRSGWMPLSWVK